MINPRHLSDADALRSRFKAAQPFEHLCLDDFLQPDIARALLDDFPGFERRDAADEFGRIGRKAVKTDLASISPAYARAAEYLVGDEFLESMSALTGIEGLKADPLQYGGGTHENLDGHDLDPHIDFNYDSGTRRHRRINLLVYLNPVWEEGWGGCIALHSNPWDPQSDAVRAYAPIFNRAVMFATSERSWHGFEAIRLPADAPTRSRKSLSIYLYTDERPSDEIAPEHGTFYVPRPLPGHIQTGRRLTASDMDAIQDRLTRWSHWLRFHQARELELSGHLEAAKRRGNHGVRHHARALASELAWLGEALWLAFRRHVLRHRIDEEPHG
ncbi:MAG: 2OG-Fe(II) oxygenase [Pseudomonadota bacterium]